TAVGHETVGADADDLTLLSRDVDGTRPWLDPAEPVQVPHLLKAAHRTGRPVRDVVDRLERVGLSVGRGLAGLPGEGGAPPGLMLLSRDLDGGFPWLDPRKPVSVIHVVRVAHRLDRHLSEVGARLAAFGYELPPGLAGIDREPDDLTILSRDLDGAQPWL